MTGFSKVAVYRQDLPPRGGYAPMAWAHVPARRIPLWPFVSLWFASNLFGYFYHISEKRQYWQNEMETDESRSCIEPVLLAEQDRILLRQYRANRDEETKLMKDVPDWEVGTWFGDKVFKSRTFFPDRPHLLDYYGVSRPSTQRLDVNASQWQI
ncbi:unnamed protein product [Rotaria magnacalcarata]|uniref:NADH dehydrogenase [ubiquinone] 1 alpha subcomplex subunit 13 n=1 Tax=Rotaria magnacalcarata TaxID=392030 RepID=A0A816XQG4_9BILA|nr:unnamed protein product [Rotaria magnacalcarata]CAF1487212.1 unnamed protein product [Rotaria magnacalcarata]CAF1932441.1 unnamed protein product [Rotaria magnacalcarata]CAF2118111.1 unnamed protein product [Rotaria magnacalcarata]CAF2150695.1 unnamed protein product [Rotaria magnacalcarata]